MSTFNRMPFAATGNGLAIVWLTLTLALSVAPAWAQEGEVEAAFSPPAITLGQVSTYTISVVGEHQPKSLKQLEVEGLELSYIGAGTSTQVSIVNGRAEQTVTRRYNFRATPLREGEFTVPTFLLEADGYILNVPAATLKVLPPDQLTDRNLELDDLAFLELETGEEPIYVGQVVKAVLKLYVLSVVPEAQYGEIAQEGDAFQKGAVSESRERGGEQREDLNYRTVEIPVTFIPLKSGEQEIRFSTPIEVEVPSSERRSRRSAFFRDSFFDDVFDRMSRQRTRLDLSTGSVAIDVRPLPEADRPRSFSGGIGTFSARMEAGPEEVDVGDPITVRVIVDGEGNFSRLQAPVLETDGALWRAYDSKSAFEAADELEMAGRKTFEYVIVPRNPEIVETPPARFAYFDPELASYRETVLRPVPVTVNPSRAGVAAAVAPTAPTPARSGDTGGESAGGYGPIALMVSSWSPDIRPLFLDRRFQLLQLIPLLGIGLLYGWKSLQRRRLEDEGFALRRGAGKAARKWTRQARQAAQKADPQAFYEAAHRAIQAVVSRPLGVHGETLTFAEMDRFFEQRGVAGDIRGEVQHFCEASDAIRFGGSEAGVEELREEERKLHALLAKLESVIR